MTIRRVLLGGAALAVLVVAIAAGGWWFFIREDAGLASDPPEIPEELVEATEEPSPTADGSEASGGADASDGSDASDVLTFRIIPEESEAAYFIDEELASLPLPSTAKGTTSDIEGELYLTTDGTAFAPGTEPQFTVDLRNLESDESRRDDRVQDALETDAYPYTTVTFSKVIGYDPSIPEGEVQTMQLTGTLDLHGVQREVTWEVEAFREGNVISALATTTVYFQDFDITPPTFFGLVSIDDKATLQVQLIAQPSESQTRPSR